MDSWNWLSLADLQNLLIAVAATATVVGAATAVFGSIFSAGHAKSKSNSTKDILLRFLSGDKEVNPSEIDLEGIARLDELKAFQLRYQRQARRNAFSFNLLVFGQFIIGALLASNFVQANYAKYTAILGVMVLLSSAIQQRYRPDVLATQAKQRLVKCNRFIRFVEDGILSVRARTTDCHSIFEIRNAATDGLDGLERNELTGFENYYESRMVGERSKTHEVPPNQPEPATIDPESLSGPPHEIQDAVGVQPEPA